MAEYPSNSRLPEAATAILALAALLFNTFVRYELLFGLFTALLIVIGYAVWRAIPTLDSS